MSWPDPNDYKQEQEKQRRTERERAEQTLRDVEKAKRDREQAIRRSEIQRMKGKSSASVRKWDRRRERVNKLLDEHGAQIAEAYRLRFRRADNKLCQSLLPHP